LDNPNNCKNNLEANNESDIELDNVDVDPETPELQDVSAAPLVPGLIRPTRRSMTCAEMVLMMVNTMETRRNKWNKKIYYRMCQCSFTRLFMWFD